MVRAVLDGMGDGVCVVDQNGQVLHLNQVGAQLVDVDDPAGVVGSHFADVFSDAPGSEFERAVHRTLETRASTSWEALATGPDRWVGGSVGPIDPGAVVVFRDTTTARRTQARLVQMEADLARAQQLANFGSWAWHLAEDRLEWTEEVFRLLGLEPQEIVPSTDRFVEAILPEDRPVVHAALGQVMSGGPPYRITYRIRRRDGEIRVLEANGEVISDDGLSRMLGTVHDITELKRAEDRLRSSLAEKEVLLQEVHHRVRNNLQMISSLFLLQAGEADGAAKQLLEKSRDRIWAMAKVHEALYSNQDLSDIDFAANLESVASALVRTHGRDDFPPELVVDVSTLSLSLDAAVPCGLIVNELVSRALDNARGYERTVRIEVNCCESEGQIILGVADDCPPPARASKGSELAVRLVRALAAQLGGELETSSDAGGRRAVVTFPVGA